MHWISLVLVFACVALSDTSASTCLFDLPESHWDVRNDTDNVRYTLFTAANPTLTDNALVYNLTNTAPETCGMSSGPFVIPAMGYNSISFDMCEPNVVFTLVFSLPDGTSCSGSIRFEGDRATFQPGTQPPSMKHDVIRIRHGEEEFLERLDAILREMDDLTKALGEITDVTQAQILQHTGWIRTLVRIGRMTRMSLKAKVLASSFPPLPRENGQGKFNHEEFQSALNQLETMMKDTDKTSSNSLTTLTQRLDDMIQSLTNYTKNLRD